MDPEAQWRALYCALDPGSEPPVLEHQAPGDIVQSGALGNDGRNFSEALPSIEEAASGWSNHGLLGMGLMTPTSSGGRSSQTLSELVEYLQKQMTELQSRLAADMQRMNELEKQNEVLQKQKREVQNLLGLVWDTFGAGLRLLVVCACYLKGL